MLERVNIVDTVSNLGRVVPIVLVRVGPFLFLVLLYKLALLHYTEPFYYFRYG